MARKLLLYLTYDGTEFCGYQAQPNGYSVQEALNAAAYTLFGTDCDITGCSRTDSGVHAKMYCATVAFQGTNALRTSIPADRFPRVINAHLPDAVAVVYAQWVPSDFHPRYDVTSKEYVYRIYTGPVRYPFETGRSFHYPRPISNQAFDKMREAAAAFVGKRDFAACMASGSVIGGEHRSTVREIFSASLTRKGAIITFRVRGDGFLYNMVRIMVGTLIDVAEGRIPPESIPARLDSLDRKNLGRTAPPEGLYLNAVYYDDPNDPGYHGAEPPDDPTSEGDL